MSEIKVNKISPRTACGTTTLGDSGDTFTIPAGATITNNGTAAGFGSTGEVSWNTTKITADPNTAATGVGYFTDTSGSAFNVTLPASPSAGNVVAVADYANTWDTNNLTIARNGSNIEGAASDFVCNKEGSTITFVYVDATKGWVVTNTGNSSQAFETKYVTATGGTETTSGDYKIHTFTGPGTFTVSCAGNSAGSSTVDYLVVAGGGNGGGDGAGGGGAGGYRESSGTASGSYTVSPLGSGVAALPVSVQGYPIAVGGGGSGEGSPARTGNSGSNSSFSTITSAGGGGGGAGNTPPGAASAGGSGGGSGRQSPRAAGAGNTPPVSPPQGNSGAGASAFGNQGGGGGGALGPGAEGAPVCAGGNGGGGATSSINATPTVRAGGGGGASTPNSLTGGSGGAGGGGNGGGGGNSTGVAGTVNTGSGGGGGSATSPAPSTVGGAGGSGIVIIRYKFQN
jgi:hypothetical protein